MITNPEFRPSIPHALVCKLTEQLSKHLTGYASRPVNMENKTAIFAQRMYVAGIQDVLGLLGMHPNPWWTVCLLSGRPVAYDLSDALRRQTKLADALLQWHGGQDSALYAVGSTMLHCSEQARKIYRVWEHAGHETARVPSKALEELRELRQRANYPEALTDDDVVEAKLLADSLEKFFDEFGCCLIPEFEIRPPTPERRLDTLLARDVDVRHESEQPDTDLSAQQIGHRYRQAVLLEYRNGIAGVEVFESANPITIERVAEFLQERDDFDEERDSITFVDDPAEEATPLDDAV